MVAKGEEAIKLFWAWHALLNGSYKDLSVLEWS